ncbi:MAG TPA: ATP-binding protein [Solimonas sp.]|nr:ATP-binding protein [Solimonas sp.]
MTDDLNLREDTAHGQQAEAPWRILVVDDDPEVFAVTQLALGDFEFAGRGVQLLTAASAAEARALLARDSGVALVLLDVVMESEHAGLDLVRYIRQELGNSSTRIVLRTGQPGQAPPRDIVSRFEIDDYRTKTELTYERLQTLVVTSLRTYRLLQRMEAKQRELARSNRELEAFAYVASHDLQTPLRSVVGFAQLLQSGYRDTLDERGRELLDYIVAGGREMRAVISDLLDYARIGSAAAEHAPLDLNQVFANACQQLQATIRQREASVTSGPLPTVRANATQMEQLFRNLIDNGLKFQPGAQPVVRVEAQALTEGGWELRFTDRGIGIAPQHLGTIFELFQRLHAPDKFPGTGMGLAICRKIVQVHGGVMRVESTPGQGSSFIFSLPGAAP